MIEEAEQFADEDKKTKERIDAKNAMDNYLHSMTKAVEESLKDKLDDDEKEEITEAVKEGQSWMAENPEADAEDIKEKQKEVESVYAPIVSKHYGGAGGMGGDDDDDDDDDDAHDEL
jgi:heat shock protein 5